MRFTTLLYSGVFALATAQSSTNSAAPTTTDAATAAQNSQQAAIIACIGACKEGDVDCTAKCITVPNPSAADADATNKCVSDCPKGNGTATDNANYSNCVEGCIGKFYYTTSAGAGAGAQPTGGSGSGSGSANTDVAASGSGSPTGSGSRQSSGTAAPSTTSSPNFAAPGLAVAGSTAGFVGFLAALLAL